MEKIHTGLEKGMRIPHSSLRLDIIPRPHPERAEPHHETARRRRRCSVRVVSSPAFLCGRRSFVPQTPHVHVRFCSFLLPLSLSLSLSDRTIPTSLSSSSFSTSKRICQTSEPFCFARPEWEREKAGREKGGGGEGKEQGTTGDQRTDYRDEI